MKRTADRINGQPLQFRNGNIVQNNIPINEQGKFREKQIALIIVEVHFLYFNSLIYFRQNLSLKHQPIL